MEEVLLAELEILEVQMLNWAKTDYVDVDLGRINFIQVQLRESFMSLIIIQW